MSGIQDNTPAPMGNTNPTSECSICLEPVRPTQEVGVAGCSHAFHFECVAAWTRSTSNQHFNCPNCRQEFSLSFMGKIMDFMAARYNAEAQRLRHPAQVVNRRFYIHIDAEALPGRASALSRLNRSLNADLELLWYFVQAGFDMEMDFSRIMNLPFRWHTQVLDDILSNYEGEQFPRTDYVTLPTLLRLTAIAALVYQLDKCSHRYRSSVEYAQLLTRAEAVLLQAQLEASEAVGTPEIHQYRRVLDHDDEWLDLIEADRYPTEPVRVRNGTIMMAGDQTRIKWIVNLRIKVRGKNSSPMGAHFRGL